MHEVLVNRLGGLSLPRKSVVRVTDRPDMTLDVYRGRKTTIQYNTKPDIFVLLTSYQIPELLFIYILNTCFFSESGPTIFVTVITMEY